MLKKYLIPFLGCIALLISSEYFLLQEAYTGRRTVVLLLCTFGIIASVIAFLYFWRSYRRLTK